MTTVLVTGASSGIGKQLASDYAEVGCNVYACGRDLNKLSKQLRHPNITYLVFDVTNEDDCLETLTKLSDIDLVILNAGVCIYVDDPIRLSSESFKSTFETNVMGYVYCLKALLPNLSSGAQIGFISSAVTYLPFTRSSAYGASKAAVDYMAKSLAVDLASRDIHVSLIRPGFVETPLTQKNDFPMPFLISSKKSSKIIRRGLSKRKREINFPGIFILILKTLAILPASIWFKLAVASNRKAS